ncbi:hypothetical protein GF376_02345 [Candidatus Peregrinibacteria bacterium]|nr:hypothetical protein [Candidatus Peregrinibacteria bacterium]
MPKTGTTSIQHFLSNNQEKLLEKGYLYPKSGRISTARNITICTKYHHGLARALLEIYDPKAPWANANSNAWKVAWKDLKREIQTSKAANIIISSEAFTGRQEFYNPDLIALTKTMLEEYDTKIIIYVRRQDEFIRSFYGEHIKNMALDKKNLRNFILEWTKRVNYYKLLEPWKKSFGIQNVIVRPFEKEQMKNSSLLEDFLENIHLNHINPNESNFNFSSSMSKNISYSGKVIKLIDLIEETSQIRRLIKLLQKSKKYWYWHKRYGFLRRGINLIIKLAIYISRFIPDFLISEELISKKNKVSIMKEFEESNQKVAKEYLGREDGKLFYSKP